MKCSSEMHEISNQILQLRCFSIPFYLTQWVIRIQELIWLCLSFPGLLQCWYPRTIYHAWNVWRLFVSLAPVPALCLWKKRCLPELMPTWRALDWGLQKSRVNRALNTLTPGRTIRTDQLKRPSSRECPLDQRELHPKSIAGWLWMNMRD